MPGFPATDQHAAGHSLPTHIESRVGEVAEAENRAKRTLIKNRRKRYLDLHPEYFSEPHLELADPLLYDCLIRRFQSAPEREREGREKGYSGILEANLVRSEAKLTALDNPDPNSPLVYSRAPDGSVVGVEAEVEDRARDRQDGERKWRDVMELRFLRGDDRDFEYENVDGNEEFDDHDEDRRRRLEAYLDEEVEEFVGDGSSPAGETGVQDF